MSVCVCVCMCVRSQDLTNKIVALGDACQEVIQSSEQGVLNTILGLALLFGNFMNYGASQGLAAGFPIEYLLKLKECRSPINKGFTLVHSLARYVY